MSRYPRVVVIAGVSFTVLSPLEMDMHPVKSTAPHNKSISTRIKSLLRFSECLLTQQSVPLLIVFLLRDNSFVVGGL